jgi:hypothetical protein
MSCSGAFSTQVASSRTTTGHPSGLPGATYSPILCQASLPDTFLLLTLGLTVTQTRWKRPGILAGDTNSHAAAGVAGHAEPYASSQMLVPGNSPDTTRILRASSWRCSAGIRS